MTTIYDFIKAKAENITAVKNFDFGSFLYLQNRLIQMSKDIATYKAKFPMLFLIVDPIQEKVGAGANEYPLHVVIVNLTDPKYTTQQRLDLNFKPTLIPIYDEFIKQLTLHWTDDGNTIQHTKIDHFYYSAGTAQDANKFAEYLDAIEIINLNFEIDLNDCTNK